VCEVARDAVVWHLDSLWFETVIVETNPKNPLPSQTRFCWKQFAQMTEQGPQRGFNRLAANFVLLELARTKIPDPAPFPSPVTRAQEPLNNGRGQAVLRCLAGRFSNALIYLREFVMFRRQVNHWVYISLPARRTR
jgi:hypothetical protein